MKTASMCSFGAKIASYGYHVYKETSWSRVQDREKVKVELERNIYKKVDPYACIIRAKEEYFEGRKQSNTFQEKFLDMVL